MKMSRHPDRHFRVVRFMDQWPFGRAREILLTDVTWEDAERLAFGLAINLKTETIVIEDQDDPSKEFDFECVADPEDDQ